MDVLMTLFGEGKDLTAVIKEKGRLSFEECADVIYQTCTALDAAQREVLARCGFPTMMSR